VTPRRLLKVAARAAAAHGLSHPLHVHAPGLGEAGNVEQTIELIDALAGHPLHLAHAQFSAYASHADGHYTSGTRQLLNRFHQAGRVTMDTGCIGFGPAWMVTRDQLLARRLAAALKQTATYREGWAVMPMRYSPTNPINALQWAIGLELILRCEDRTRLAMSVDFPNGGSFTAMPKLLELLSSPEKREEMLESLHPWAKERSEFGRLDHALSDEALVTLTRYAPANALGLTHKGHLQPGADADIVIADRPFALPSLVIKAGRVVRENDRHCQEAPARRVS
jgi:formylmethanofuran dehydrogenase subunit A